MVHEKKIVEQVPGWLTVYDDGSVDRTWSGPPQFKFMAEPVPPHEEFINGVATRDVVTDPNEGSRVRIYLPDSKTDKLPILLHFHGGGYCVSQPDWYMYYNFYTQLAREAGAICVSVYLRRAPEHRLPAPIDDGYSALLWLRSVAQAKSHEPWLNARGDFNRVFLIGESSGGNMIHHVSARAGSENLSPLKLAGAIQIHPGFHRTERSKSELELPESPFLTLEIGDKFLSLALPVGSTRDHPIVCPMGTAMMTLEGMNLPAVFLLCVGEKDLMIDREMEYYEEMKKGGIEIELLISYGMGHCFYLNKAAIDMDPITSSETEKLIQGIAEFVNNH